MSQIPEITKQDCEDLYNQFIKYTETAEQHEFALLAMINLRLDADRARNWEMPQEEARAMFWVVLKAIGKDNSAYEKEAQE